MSAFGEELGIPMVNLGAGNGENRHAPNEYVSLKYLFQDLQTIIRFVYGLGSLDKTQFRGSGRGS
jgi:acetylornithine deacetylase/succinyl-diaminopimelate desuccinylase-like protein